MKKVIKAIKFISACLIFSIGGTLSYYLQEYLRAGGLNRATDRIGELVLVLLVLLPYIVLHVLILYNLDKE